MENHIVMIKRMVLAIFMLLISLSISAQTPIPAQPESLRSVNWHPEDVLLARAFQNGTVDILDTSTTPETVIFSYSIDEAPASVVRWSTSGDKLAAGIGNDVHIWDFNDNETHIILQGHVTPVISLAWSPDDTQLASVSETRENNNFIVWELSSGIESVSTHIRQSYAIDWQQSGENSTFVSSVSGLTLIEIDPMTGLQRPMIENGGLVSSGILSLAWNRLNTQIAAASALGDIVIYGSNSAGQYNNVFISSSRVRINTISWSGDDQFIASGDDAGIIRIWSLASSEEVTMIDTGEDAIFSIDWNPVTNVLAYGGTSGHTGLTPVELHE